MIGTTAVNKPMPPPPPKRRLSVPISNQIPPLLPHERMYSIQIGYKLFKLSGASLSSDGPSYFTNYFLDSANESKTLFIDRSPKIFEKIYMHLQGYSITIDNETEFLHLLADSLYYHLVKLRDSILKYDIFANVGGRCFRISKELLTSEGNYPNYFSITFNATMIDPFKIEQLRDLIRPPRMMPFISTRSASLFQDLLDQLQGKTVEIRNDEHRRNLIDECRYYNFFALEQEFIKCKINQNPFSGDQEIVINYEDVKRSNISRDPSDLGLARYSRPFIDKNVSRTVVLQIRSSEVSLLINLKSEFVSLLVVGKTAKKLKGILDQISKDSIYEETEKDGVWEFRLTVLIKLPDCSSYINGMEVDKDWIQNLLARHKTIDNGLESGNRETISSGEVVQVKVTESQWTIGSSSRTSSSGDVPVWMNGLLLKGILDQTNFYKSQGFL